MEKLQAALAKARAQRDGDPVPRGSKPELSARAKSRRTAETEAQDSVWGAVPLFEPTTRRMHQSRIFAADASNEGTHFDILRTKLLLEMRRNNWKRIAITSALAGSGKTTTACNLIAGFGRQPEVRCMLFDVDLRRPSVAKFFGAAPENGLVDVLEGKVRFEDQAVRLHPNTIVSMTNRPLRDPSQLLSKQQTAETLDEVQDTYQPDIMLFDLPPVLVSDETRAFLKLVDAALIVAASDTTSVAQVDEVEREVSEYTNVAGVILNKCRFMDEGYGYSY
ncbi:MAG: CpsD/CapB family tyrosine-protein kinase [Boseongicola sp.]|nr:CpsD/CapB family tyrosine-protein kinase [Boseongicola sp.]NNJ69526.1 CpsD/CapB family tyrosine-protein kinase [Boseongicola sp.]